MLEGRIDWLLVQNLNRVFEIICVDDAWETAPGVVLEEYYNVGMSS